MPSTDTLDVAVIGGGVSGLSCAHYLHSLSPRPLAFRILEASPRFGGVIQTETVHDCLLEAGPDSFLSTKPAGVELARNLGMEGEFLSPNPEHQTVWLLRNETLHPLPAGLFLGIPKKFLPLLRSKALPFRTKIRMGCEILSPPRTPAKDESVADFMGRHFGTSAVELLFEPILGGIYAARAGNLSMAATFPQFLEMERSHGSLVRALHAARTSQSRAVLSPFVSFKGGMGTLIQRLTASLPASSLVPNAAVKRVERSQDAFEIFLNDSSCIRTRCVVSTLSASKARTVFSAFPSIQENLTGFHSVTTAVFYLGYRKHAIPSPLPGFGFIVPRTDPSPLLAGSWVTQKFSHRSPEDIFLTRLFVGGEGREETAELSEADLLTLGHREMQRLLSAKEEPVFSRLYRWPKASPLYEPGHLLRIQNLQTALSRTPGLFMTGFQFNGIGIPDSIRSAKETAARILQNLRS